MLRNVKGSKAPKVLVGVSLVPFLLAGCGNTGAGELLGGAGGAVLGGIAGSQFGGGTGKIAMTIVGAVLGGGLGNYIGKGFDKGEQKQIDHTINEAVYTGQPQQWQSPAHGDRYVNVVPASNMYQSSSGVSYRPYTVRAHDGSGRPMETVSWAKLVDGRWESVSSDEVPQAVRNSYYPLRSSRWG
jgi:surface antigen